MVCNNWDVCLLLLAKGMTLFCCWWALIEGKVLMELVVTVLGVVTMFVLMVTVAVEVETRGTAGSMVDNLGCTTGSVGIAGTKSFDCHCGIEPEKLLQRKKKLMCALVEKTITFSP